MVKIGFCLKKAVVLKDVTNVLFSKFKILFCIFFLPFFARRAYLLNLMAAVYPGATLSGRRQGHADFARLATAWLGALASE